MSKADDVINAIAEKFVAHPASSRRFLRLTPAECEYAARRYGDYYGTTNCIHIVVRASLLKHCGRRMALVRTSTCRCGDGTRSRNHRVCLCQQCTWVE